MRAILLAAAAAIWAGQAGAATYKFSYTTTSSSLYPYDPDCDDCTVGDGDWFGGYFLIDAPNLSPSTSRNSSDWGNFFITESGSLLTEDSWLGFDLLYGFDVDATGIVTPFFQIIYPFARGINISGESSSYLTFDFDFAENEGRWDWSAVSYSPVPLPATAPLLLLGIGALAMRRRHRPVDIPSVAA